MNRRRDENATIAICRKVIRLERWCNDIVSEDGAVDMPKLHKDLTRLGKCMNMYPVRKLCVARAFLCRRVNICPTQGNREAVLVF